LSTPFKRTVEAGYDRIANQYLASKDPEDPATLAALEELAGELAPGAPMLWSHHDGKTSLALLLGAGFEVKRGDPHHQRPRRRRVQAVGPHPKRRMTTCPLP
jgi:hypothetical protein